LHLHLHLHLLWGVVGLDFPRGILSVTLVVLITFYISMKNITAIVIKLVVWLIQLTKVVYERKPKLTHALFNFHRPGDEEKSVITLIPRSFLEMVLSIASHLKKIQTLVDEHKAKETELVSFYQLGSALCSTRS